MVHTNEEFIKYFKKQLAERKWTLKEYVRMLNERYNWGITVANFSARLYRSSFRFEEIVKILDMLDKQLIIVDKE